MTHFLADVVGDLRGGRTSWRVLAVVSLPSLAVTFAVAMIQQMG